MVRALAHDWLWELDGAERDGWVNESYKFDWENSSLCTMPFMPFALSAFGNAIPSKWPSFNALHQNALSEMPFRKCPFRYVLHQNALLVISIPICPFKNALSKRPFLNLPFIKLLFNTNAIFSFISDCEISNSKIMKRSQFSGKLAQFRHYLTPL